MSSGVPWSEVLKTCCRCGGKTLQGHGRPIVTDGTPDGYLCVYCRFQQPTHAALEFGGRLLAMCLLNQERRCKRYELAPGAVLVVVDIGEADAPRGPN